LSGVPFSTNAHGDVLGSPKNAGLPLNNPD
jgi:hypothetical protein